MDTKLIRYNIWIKLCVFIAACVLFAYSYMAALDIMKFIVRSEFEGFDTLTAAHYTETVGFQHSFSSVQHTLWQLRDYGSEEFISSGGYLKDNEHRIENAKNQLFDDKRWELAERRNLDHWNYEQMAPAFETEYADEIAKIPEQLTAQYLEDFRQLLAELNSRPELYYRINTDEGVIENLRGFTAETLMASSYYYGLGGAEGWVVYTEEYIDGKNEDFLAFSAYLRYLTIIFGAYLLAFLCCVAYLIFAAGRVTAEKKTKHIFIDKIYGEVTLCLIMLAVYFALLYSDDIFYSDLLLYRARWIPMSVIGVLCAAGLVFFLSHVRHIKSRTIFKHTITYTVLRFIYRGSVKLGGFIAEIFRGGPLMGKAAGVIVVWGLLMMIPFFSIFLGIVTIPLAVWLAVRKIRMYRSIQQGVTAIQKGDYSHFIDTGSRGEFKMLADSINDITAGLSSEVERRLKAERMKTELISNVSHDMRTPLTSVITYIDLLKAEETGNENIKKYVEIIDQKSDRLRRLMDDLFEAAKAASGNIPVDLTRVNAVSLIRQGLGELDDRIKASGLDFRVTLPEGGLYARADGRLLWRVLENLFSNVFKYSMEGSRVYINAFTDGSEVKIEVKNISATELRMEESELTERFTRGDESRGSPGSGLGLAIAKSLMLAQGGALEIKTDGDLFKASVTLPAAQM